MIGQGRGMVGPQRDDVLKRGFRTELVSRRQARGEDWREPDMPDEDELDAERALAGSAGERLAGIEDWDGTELRTELARHLDRTAFPGRRGHLIQVLAAHQAGPQLRDLVASLPDRRFGSLADVLSALGLPVDR